MSKQSQTAPDEKKPATEKTTPTPDASSPTKTTWDKLPAGPMDVKKISRKP